MARIRTVKPEFWTSEQVMELSPIARLAFVGMWNFCDDQGVHPASAKTLKAEVFPADDIPASDVQAMVDQMIQQGLIKVFESAGKPYWWVTGWNHQKIDKPTNKYPKPDFSATDQPPVSDNSASPRLVVGESSPPEGKGREGKGKEVNPTSLRDVPPSDSAKQKSVTLSQWMAGVHERGEKLMSDYTPLNEYTEKVGLPADWVELAWIKFKDRHTSDEKAKRKRYTNWRLVFKRAVEENWMKLWFFSEKDQQFRLSTVGVSADLATREAA